MPLEFALLFWSAFAALLCAWLWSTLRRREVVGTLRNAAEAFSAPPGHLFFRHVVHYRLLGRRVIENYVVSVAISEKTDFLLKTCTPPAVRPETLKGYSDELATRLLSNFIQVRRRGTSIGWARPELETIAVALSTIRGSKGGVLEARGGRLVLTWKRGLAANDLRQQVKDPLVEALRPARQQLEQLAADLML